MSKGTILITGASSGLGEEMARQFAALGYDLALCARRTDRLEVLKSGIAADHPVRRVELKALDVNDDDAVFRVFGEFAAEFGTIDRVIINAGLGKGAALGTGRYAANKIAARLIEKSPSTANQVARAVMTGIDRKRMVIVPDRTARIAVLTKRTMRPLYDRQQRSFAARIFAMTQGTEEKS